MRYVTDDTAGINADPDVIDNYKDVAIKLEIPPIPWWLAVIGIGAVGASLYLATRK